jgi:trehalose 6-phosphate synthase
VSSAKTRLFSVSNESDAQAPSGQWSAARLQETIGQYLAGQRLLLLSHREPWIHEQLDDGAVRAVQPAGGLVTALEPVMRTGAGVWIATGTGSADREVVDANDRVRVPPGNPQYTLRRLWLSDAETKGYYDGFANGALWPLCHVAHVRPVFRLDAWDHYRTVNERFARAVVAEADREDPVVLVQDYQLALVPRMVRELLPRATVMLFWHIPWPDSERFGICPFAEEVLDGLLGASMLGFHTPLHCNNFLDTCARYLEARVDRDANTVVRGGRATRVRAYPISIDWPSPYIETLPPAEECRREIFAELGLPEDAYLGVGVDRLDYTKGIEERLEAVERLLEKRGELRGRFTFAVQDARPERRGAEHTHQPALRDLGLAADPPAARAPRAARGVPLVPRRRRLLRELAARRHEPGRQGVRRRARRRARRARALALHRRGA